MTIFHNKGEMNPVNQAEPESYDWRKELLGENSKPEEFGAQKKMKAAGKFILMAILLFATGMGAGWLALSLPNRFNNAISQMSALPEENREKAQEDYKNPNWESAKGVEQETLTVIDLTNNNGTLLQKTKPERNSGAKIANSQAPKQMKVKTDRGKYSLQVGACQSEKCVNTYRKILQSHVNLESIQVSEKRVPGGKNIIRRIRIAPLNRVAARTLRGKLAATDPRFKDAYVVSLK